MNSSKILAPVERMENYKKYLESLRTAYAATSLFHGRGLAACPAQGPQPLVKRQRIGWGPAMVSVSMFARFKNKCWAVFKISVL